MRSRNKFPEVFPGRTFVSARHLKLWIGSPELVRVPRDLARHAGLFYAPSVSGNAPCHRELALSKTQFDAVDPGVDLLMADLEEIVTGEDAPTVA